VFKKFPGTGPARSSRIHFEATRVLKNLETVDDEETEEYSGAYF
jgi:hypothetical protein